MLGSVAHDLWRPSVMSTTFLITSFCSEQVYSFSVVLFLLHSNFCEDVAILDVAILDVLVRCSVLASGQVQSVGDNTLSGINTLTGWIIENTYPSQSLTG